MLDRASTFADKQIVQMLKNDFIPVAIDQAYQRRQKDTEGDFYRKIAGQGPRNNFQSTTQGFYIAAADGELLLFNNNRDPQKVRRLMRQKLARLSNLKAKQQTLVLVPETVDPRYNIRLPKGAAAVRVRAKVLGGYEPTENEWRKIFQTALSRDNLWITGAEIDALENGQIPRSLQARLARFHLVDNTRGEPPMWKKHEIRKLEMRLEKGILTGQIELSTDSSDRGFITQLRGIVEIQDGNMTRFDLVAKGDFWGEGRYTRRAPQGKFPLAISFTLADGTDIADEIPPQGARGWLAGYLNSQ